MSLIRGHKVCEGQNLGSSTFQACVLNHYAAGRGRRVGLVRAHLWGPDSLGSNPSPTTRWQS